MGSIWRAAPWLVMVAALATTLLAAVFGFKQDQRKHATARADVARSASVALETSLRVTVERTQTVAGLFDASQSVTEGEFTRFAAPLLRTSGAAAVVWLEHFPDAERRTFERRLGSPILRLGTDGRLERQGQHSSYDVFLRVASREKTRSTVGLDLGANPARAPTLRAAQAARAPRSTPIVKLAGSLKPGIVVYVPVFDRRIRALRGFAGGAYRVDRLNADVRAALPAGTGVRLAQDGQITMRSGDLSDPVERSVAIAGQRWDLAVSSPASGGLGYGPAALLIGSPLSGLVALAALLVARRARQSEAMAQRHTIERDDAQRGRRASEQRLTTAFEEAPIGMAMIGLDGAFVRVNRALAEISGYAASRLVEMNVSDLVPADRRAAMLASFVESARADPFVPFATTRPLAHASGETRWIALHTAMLTGSDGRPGLVLHQVLDISERLLAEAALAASERRTRAILETAHDAFISMNASGRITDWNPRAQAMFGWTREEALGRSLADTIIPQGLREAHHRGLERFVGTGVGSVTDKLLELTALRRDGREFPVELTISPSLGDDGYSFNAFLRDVSDRKRTQEVLAAAHARAIESSRLKSEFVANMSHEIRTPLNGVIGLSGLLLDTELSPEQREYADGVLTSGDALLTLIDDVLDFSKIEAGKLELDVEPFDVRRLVEEVRSMVSATAQTKGVALTAHVAEDVPLAIGDGNRIRQVLSNLATNAIKFTAIGEVAIEVTAVREAGEQVTLRFEVTDTGIGVEASALDKIFESFAQADGSTTRRYGGTGLGLTISKQLIGLMDGQIGVRSTLGEGSTFWFAVQLESASTGASPPVATRPRS